MRKYYAIACVLLVSLLAGCENTVQGFGQDTQRMGQAIQKSVN